MENDEDKESRKDAGALGFMLAVCGFVIVYMLYLLGQ
jgi:hypothetical protein